MPLTKVAFKPGFNKQETASGAEGQWIDGDFVRFRYGQPEKIGGWQQLVSTTLAGPARAQLTWTAIDGKRYAAIGTNKLLVIYYEGDFYDITPLGTAITACTFDSTTGSPTVTVNKTGHGLLTGEYIVFSSVTLPGGGVTGYVGADFTTNPFEIISSTSNTFTITMASNESGSGMSAQGSATVTPYVTIGPPFETYGYGFGTGEWNSSSFGWGDETDTAATVSLDPGSWSLDNFGQILIATITKGKTYTWDPSAANRLETRATVMSGAPTKTTQTLVSDRDRHLFHFGTETTIGDVSTFDPMFFRFSNQEDYNTYTPTATNTAGFIRLDTGNKIIGAIQGKDYVFALTDQAAYVIQYVGAPFTFSVRQVGTNCGCIGQHAMVYAQGSVFWMGYGGGFFMFDGTVKQIPSLVEDYVFKNGVTGNPGINYDAGELIYAGHNSLFNEVTWFYSSQTSQQINRSVTFNFAENTWVTSSLARTTYDDAQTYDLPYATKYNKTGTPTFPTINGVTNSNGASIYYAHETGTNEVDTQGNETAIPAFIRSGDFDISEQGRAGDGQLIMRVRRFVPDFQNLSGNAKVTLFISDYPSESQRSASTGPLITGPFTVSTSTTKVDTRVRGRLVSVKIENDAIDQTWRYGTLRLDIEAGGRR